MNSRAKRIHNATNGIRGCSISVRGLHPNVQERIRLVLFAIFDCDFRIAFGVYGLKYVEVFGGAVIAAHLGSDQNLAVGIGVHELLARDLAHLEHDLRRSGLD